MPLLGFTVFKEKILDGSKTQTIRKIRKYPIRVGDRLHLYWHPRQKDCEKLGEAICNEIEFIQIHSEYFFGKQRPLVFRYCGLGKAHDMSAWDKLNPYEIKELLTKDGFENEDDFLNFFIKHYGSGESFQVIRWSSIGRN